MSSANIVKTQRIRNAATSSEPLPRASKLEATWASFSATSRVTASARVFGSSKSGRSMISRSPSASSGCLCRVLRLIRRAELNPPYDPVPSVPNQERVTHIQDQDKWRWVADHLGGVRSSLPESPPHRYAIGLPPILVLSLKDEVTRPVQVR